MRPMKWKGSSLSLLDQTLLPDQEVWIECRSYEDVAAAIEDMRVRGAPAIGAAAAFGVALGAMTYRREDTLQLSEHIERVIARLAKTRPTAVNLFWALERMRDVARREQGKDPKDIIAAIEQEAITIAEEDVQTNKRIGRFGEKLIPYQARILTHCNTGSLATVEYGTALGVIRAAHDNGKHIQVFACETRPYLQGARLTCYELHKERIPVTLVTDSMAGFLMSQGMVDTVIVGADRITANGDVANKIGTYSLAVLAHAHGIPFYVAAPESTFDLKMTSGKQIPIEERSSREVLFIGTKRLAPEGVTALHPAFDVSPHQLITGIITDLGVIERPDARTVSQFFAEHPRRGKQGGLRLDKLMVRDLDE